MKNTELKKSLNLEITLYWWNFGTKTKDFEGTYKEWFKKHSISISETEKTLNFSGTFGSLEFNIKQSKYYIDALNFIIKICLTNLGDKALLKDGDGRVYKINWR